MKTCFELSVIFSFFICLTTSASTLENVDIELASNHLSQAVQFQSITFDDSSIFDQKVLVKLNHFLKNSYPHVHSQLKREEFPSGILYTWVGKNPQLKPVLFAAHLDVVPVEKNSELDWKYPPFSGKIAEGFIWGRGALDDKGAAITIFEAVETLLTEGFAPEQTIYMAFGLDEEGGKLHDGAQQISEALSARGVSLDYVLDEGSGITDGIVPDLNKKVALIGITEKGYLTIELSVHAPPGHSSMPPKQTAIGILSSAIEKLETNQMPAQLNGTARKAIESLAVEMPTLKKWAISNLWLLSPLVVSELKNNPTTAPTVRTTTAVTMISGGTKDNVLPSEAKASVNFRVSPHDHIKDVLAHVQKVISDERVVVKVHEESAHEASPVSSTDSHGFDLLKETIHTYFKNTIVAPSITLAATDARHYYLISKDVYRFYPSILKKDDLARYHGVNERLGVEDLGTAIRFYKTLMKNNKS